MPDQPKTLSSSGPAVSRATGSRRSAERREEILAATRALFDESGSREAQIDDIANAVGINRAVIYRHFSSKAELFAEAVVLYLGELGDELETAAAQGGTPEESVGRMSDAIIDFGLRNPAFVDCALTLVRLPAEELMIEVGEPAVVRLGAAMWACLQFVVEALDAGVKQEIFAIEDPVLLANLYYTEALGILSFAALQMSVSQGPAVSTVPIDQSKRYARIAALSQARGH